MNSHDVKWRMEHALSELRMADEMESDLGIKLCVASARKSLDEIFAGLFAEWAEQNQPNSTN